MKYKITIEETISQEFEKEANSIEEAKDKAIKDYESGKLVLEFGTVLEKQINVINESNNETTGWEEF